MEKCIIYNNEKSVELTNVKLHSGNNDRSATVQ